MGLLGFLVGVAFIPWINGAATAPRWALLSVVVPVMVIFARPVVTVAHVLGALFLGYCALTLLWTPALWDSLDGLWKFALLGGLFVIGSQLRDTRSLFIGLGCAAAVNAIVMLAQSFGFEPIPQRVVPGGLFVNANNAAEFCALVLVGLIGHRLWWLVPFPVMAISLTTSRGALMALGAALAVWLWDKYRATALVLLVSLAGLGVWWLVTVDPIHADTGQLRLRAWRDTLADMTWHGMGINSFALVYQGAHPWVNTHNDLLQIAYETGVGSVFFFALLVFAVFGSDLTERAVLAAFLMEGLVGFPLYLPSTAFIAALVAGLLCRGRMDLRDCFDGWRASLWPRYAAIARPDADRGWQAQPVPRS